MARPQQVFPAPRTLAEVPRMAAVKHGSNLALRAAGTSGLEALTYEELDRRSANVRDRLGALVEEGDRVVLAGHSSIEWVFAFFGVLRLGAIPVPLNPDLDDESLRSILSEVRPAAVVGDKPFLDRLGRHPCARVELSAIEEPGLGVHEVLDSTPDPECTALLLYTTDTMGRPKGVLLSHRNILSNAEAIADATNLGADDSVLTPLPLFHAFPLTVGLLAPLIQGIRIELEAEPTRLASRLQAARPTLILGVPALYETVFRQVHRQAENGLRGRCFKFARALNRLLVRAIGLNAGKLLFRPVHRALGGRLRYAVSGGAPLSRELQREAIVLGIPLLQGYGMTEASPVIAVQRFDSRRFWFGKRYWKAAGSCGPPLRGVEPSFEGEETDTGEVVVSGPNVMQGYFRRDQETRQTLRDRRLHTGDVGSLDRDGNLRIRGRGRLALKNQRGEMIHLDRIADTLALAPEISRAYVFASDELPTRLTAVVLPASEAGAESAEVTAADVEDRVLRACQRVPKHLATYERVDHVRLTDEPLPTTPLGKIRAALVSREPSFDLTRWRAQLL